MGVSRCPRPCRVKRADARRRELLRKMFAATPAEEKYLRYDEHPGLRERHEALHRAALTPAEHAELERLEGLIDADLSRKSPLPTGPLDELEAAVRELEAKAERRRAASDAKASDGD